MIRLSFSPLKVSYVTQSCFYKFTRTVFNWFVIFLRDEVIVGGRGIQVIGKPNVVLWFEMFSWEMLERLNQLRKSMIKRYISRDVFCP